LKIKDFWNAVDAANDRSVMTWRERYDKAYAALNAATDRCNTATTAEEREAAEAAQREAQAAYDAIIDEAEVGTGRATIN
jgi:hypothetical protein